MKKVIVNVTYKYELEIDENDSIVKDYESENDLLVDCASYRFSATLPVIGSNGVRIKDIELVSVD